MRKKTEKDLESEPALHPLEADLHEAVRTHEEKAQCDNDLVAVITCLSEARRGAPLTVTEPYALIPILNQTLLLHQLDALKGYGKIYLLHNEKNDHLHAHGTLSARVELIDEKDESVKKILSNATVLLPSDVLPIHVPAAKHIMLVASDGSEEEETLMKFLKRLGLTELFTKIVAEGGLRINYPWEILDANQRLCKHLKHGVDSSAVIEEGVVIKGNVRIGKKTIVRAGSYIEGPVVIGDNCEIGPMAHIRPETSIGDDCRIGKTEIVDSVIMKGMTSKHAAYLGHSVLGEDVNVAAMCVTADYRHDASEHITLVDGKKVNTKRKKLGAFIGDHCRLGISTCFYPGRKLWPGSMTLPGEIVKEDKIIDDKN